MAEKEKTTDDKKEEKKARQQEITNNIQTHIIQIKTTADLFTALLTGKEVFTEENLDAAFEYNDQIEEQVQEIIALLFDLRDNM
ncbi:MAG: hypothetical protein RDU01_08070 [Thermodesulfovibrionales bacterium]|nr:hypothetical protein [Thermodesulfovibrionales bacterium]